MEKLTQRQKTMMNWGMRGTKKPLRTRTKEEILRQIEWADQIYEKLEKNIPEHRRSICGACGTLFDKYWKSAHGSEYCAMCAE